MISKITYHFTSNDSYKYKGGVKKSKLIDVA